MMVRGAVKTLLTRLLKLLTRLLRGIAMDKPLSFDPNTASLIAGALSGVVGLLVFLTIHHFWIRPIWSIAPIGLIIAALGGLAVGWAYNELRSGLPPRPLASLAMVGLIAAILAPAILLSFTHGPLFDLETANIRPGEGGQVALRIGLELILTATVMGALAGWLIGRSPRAALATAVAGFVFAIGPGHNIPMFGATPVAVKQLVILLAVVAVSAITLVEGGALLTRPAP